MSAELDLPAHGKGVPLVVDLHRPEAGENLRDVFAATQTNTMPGNLRAGAVHQQNSALQVGREQAAPHRLDDVVVEYLQVFERFALFLELHSLLADCLGQQTPQVCDREKCKEIASEPGLERSRTWNGRRGLRNPPVIRHLNDTPEQHKAESGHEKRAAPREKNAAHQNGKEVKRSEIAVLRATRVDHACDDGQI